ncbi:FH protein interacting protein FIP2-like [Rosa sericea]
MSEEEFDSSSIVRLNIGGQQFCTTVYTLIHREPNSKLAAIMHQDPEIKYVFYDRDGQIFSHILNWLRHGVLPDFEVVNAKELFREAEYYQLHGLKDNIPDFTSSYICSFGSAPYPNRRNFRGAKLCGLNLSSQANFTGSDFRSACLRNVSFSHSNLMSSKFDIADAEGADFRTAKLVFCSFTGANLRRALFSGAELLSATLNNADLRNTNLEGANLRRATLNNADLKNANLEGANLSYATLNNADLTNANLKGANLFQAMLKGVKLSKTNLKYADLRGAYRWLSEADLEEAYLEGAKLTSCFPFLW